jgi:hypothetical protein
MRYFIDTEFIEDGQTIDLISIGIVAEDGRTYYAISAGCDHSRANDWVKQNVLSRLGSPDDDNHDWRDRDTIRDEVIEFVGTDQHPEFWGYYADYDWVVFCWLFGTMMDLPKHFPMYCCDLKQMLDDLGNPKVPFKPDDEHNALSDARWNKRVYDWIQSIRSSGQSVWIGPGYVLPTKPEFDHS